VEKGLHHHFDAVTAKKGYNSADVEAGRAYTHAYVEFVHYAERLYDATETRLWFTRKTRRSHHRAAIARDIGLVLTPTVTTGGTRTKLKQ
jgi:hypothetical protein